jgi:hypothetical protein
MSTVPFLHDIRVFDANGVHVLGHLVAVDDGGLDMLSDQAFNDAQEHMFMLDDITAFEPGKKAVFCATCDYCDLDTDVMDLYHVHLSFTRLSPQASEVATLLS